MIKIFPLGRIALISAILVTLVGCDRATKTIAENHLKPRGPVTFLAGIFRLEYAENAGAFLSWGGGLSDGRRFWLLTVLAGFFLAGLLIYLLIARLGRTQTVALSLVLAGGLGNLIDRLLNEGGVIDFMNIGLGKVRTGIFNVADVAITLGIGLFWVSTMKEERFSEKDV
ncbi:MAG: signal peptidase II [Candidatus Manganitrophaceae bacterium]